MIQPSKKNACVVGWPITQSRSPLIHSYWLETYNIAGSYTKVAVEPEHIDRFLTSLAERGYVGCNVTVPHKEIAYQRAAIKDASAVAIGAANTIWLQDGRLACSNTDSYGFMTNLTTTAPAWTTVDGAVLVLGAGGSARAIVYGLMQSGRRDIRVFNRSIERADALADHFGIGVTAHAWSTRNAHVGDAALIVNTTTLGMNNIDDPDIDVASAPAACIAADLVYVPLETRFLRAARQHGLATVGGLGMLLHQAVPGFAQWFGVTPEVTDDLMQRIALNIEAA